MQEHIEKHGGKAVKEERGKSEADLLAYVEKTGEVDTMQLIEKFGDAAVDALIACGALIERNGKISLLR